MSKRCHTAEQIIGKLREAEVLLAQGWPAPIDWSSFYVSPKWFWGKA